MSLMIAATPTILVPTPVVLNPGNPRLGIWPQLFLPALGGWTFGDTVLSRTVSDDPVWLVWINFRYPNGLIRPVYQFPVPLPPSPPSNNTTTQTSASAPRSTTNTAIAPVHAGSRPSSATSRMAPPPPPSGSRLAPRAPASSSAVGHAPAPASRGRTATAPRRQPVTAAPRPISSSRRPSTPVASTSGSRAPNAAPTTPPRRKIAPLPRSKKEVPSTQRSGERVPPLSPSGNTMAAGVTSSAKSPVRRATVGEAENVPPSEPTTASSSSPTRKRKEARDVPVESATRPQLNHEDYDWYETGCLMLNGDLPIDYALFQGKLLDAQVEDFERDFIDYKAGDDTRAKQLAALQ
ncbi:hypothetical protein EXIGLDRAFT_770290 [Exidia glandulosa HHB12029]|uniref:Uncharacterized protein n=1 Tax=Exidia glandulosa HHB12029 TaxID=1314781 RepID=A0A165GUC0_EXIGL|nr:hypothetical protein EXIGLDRAFT_770290 [Exidia glandulosa HHB12029]